MHAIPPRYDLWPESVQHAMRLRGALIPCGPGMRGAAWPDTPRVRLAAIGFRLDRSLVAAYLTAAWVWGAATDPGSPLSVAAAAGSARAPVAPGTRRYELRFAPGDISELGEFGVTSPTRTLLDLLHRPILFDESTRDACSNLLELIPHATEHTIHEVNRRRRPHVRLARERLHDLLANPSPRLPVDSVQESPKEWTHGT